MSNHNDWGRHARELAGWGREDIVSHLLNHDSRPRLDFTPEYLSKLTTEQLRHLLLAAMLTMNPN
jgi:hypothetical protein